MKTIYALALSLGLLGPAVALAAANAAPVADAPPSQASPTNA
jgi:hypothetical protein